MKLKYPYAMYDNGVYQGEHTSKEWAEMLQVSVHLVRDYAREGRSYKGRYTFKAMREEKPEELTQPEDAKITVQDLQEFRRTLKVGSKFVYEDSSKVVVVRKYRNLVELVRPEDPKRTVTMTYMELYKQKKNRSKKRLTAGR
ncbi:hypothetical protein [Clostridium sp. HBUAS56010]|uniref:hypothetical protein n=1 Tax=Clostridium sp. HBUAS56010 TaxID=2571127 RepID=UPI0011786572|nr:hypothetical protein [Clostridium sp. HBUAS56010]